MSILCHHCGEDIIDGEEGETDDEENMCHKACRNFEIPRCQKAVKEFIDIRSPSETVLFCGIHVHNLYGPVQKPTGKDTKRRKKKEKREVKQEEVIRIASALRNSNSGFLLIQIVGMDMSDKFFFGALDELLDDKLNRLIEDGNLFSNVFTKTLMCIYQGLEEYHDIVVLYVEASPLITTADFKTKISLDEGIETPSPLTVFRFISKGEIFKECYPEMYKALDIEVMLSLKESRSLQMKSTKDEAQEMASEELTNYIINSLRLTEYISAFSKNKTGGTYLVGIREKDKHFKDKNYISKAIDIHGVKLSDCKKTIDGIIERVKQTILICDYEGNIIEDVDVVKVDAVPCSEEDEQRYIIGVCVRPVTGVVFYDKDGPVAYEISCSYRKAKVASISRISLDKWFKTVHKTQRF